MRDMRCTNVAGCLAAVLVTHGLCTARLAAQSIRVGENVPVVIGLERQPLVEPHLAIDPTNPNHFLGAAIVSGVGPTRQDRLKQNTCASFVSLDGGKRWVRHDFSITECFDPWVAITGDGHAVFSALGTHAALSQQGRFGLVVFHSSDGGRTWDETPVGLGDRHDQPTMAFDASSSPRRGWLYLTSHHQTRLDDGKVQWDVFLARSRDGGRTFDEPSRVTPNNLHNLTEMPVVLSDGTLIVSYVDVQRNADGFKSRAGLLDHRRAWVLRSIDGGSTFSSPRFVNETCGPVPGYRKAALSADTSSGSFRDRLYFACIQRGGGAIVLNYSADQGEIWSDPVRVHSAAVDTTLLRENPTLAVNREGVVGIAWVDSRSAPGKRCFETYFAASLDGGRSFLPEERVSSARSCPDSTAAWNTGGDYFGMVTTPDGRFHLLWSDARAGIFQLWIAAIEVVRSR